MNNFNNSVKKWKTWEYLWLSFQVSFLTIISVFLSWKNKISLIVGILSLIATIFGTIGSFLAIKKQSNNYFFGLLHVLLYSLIALKSKVYGDFILNLFIYAPMSIIGWKKWRNHLNKENNNVKKLTNKQILIFSVSMFVGVISFGYFLFLLDDPAFLLDSASTIFSITGMILMNGFYYEQWIIWLLVNLFSIGIWIQVLIVSHDLMAIIFISMWSLYTINSIIGIIIWNKDKISKINID